jgi:hypothetical protein
MSTDDASSANRAPVQRWSSTRAWGGGAPGGAVAGHAAEELRAEHRQGTGPEQHRGAGAEELWTEEGWGALGETKQMTEPMRETGTYGFDGFFWSRLVPHISGIFLLGRGSVPSHPQPNNHKEGWSGSVLPYSKTKHHLSHI